MEKHIPVLLNEVIDGLNINPNGIYLDLTIGRAGHSSKILEKLREGKLIGFDQDETAINESKERLNKINNNFLLIHKNFVHLDEVMEELGIKEVDGILMDLGVSSPQFDEGERGFSYKVDAPLDMRMDQRNSLTAKDIVNTYSLNELCRVISTYGEDKFAYSIAKNIIKARENKPIETTFELVEIIKRSKPMKVLAKEGHPAKQTFQALRIETNQELEVLKKALASATKLLKSGGRLAVITFHSGEDKIVKDYFKSLTVVEGNRIDGPMPDIKLDYELVNRKVITASEEELSYNHRSASAKLRIIKRK